MKIYQRLDVIWIRHESKPFVTQTQSYWKRDCNTDLRINSPVTKWFSFMAGCSFVSALGSAYSFVFDCDYEIY
jgi:hypothetical protein